MRLYTIHHLDPKPAEVLIERLIPWFVPGNQTPDRIAAELEDRLTGNGQDTMVCLAMDGDYLKAFLAAYKENNRVFVWQFQKQKGFPHSHRMLEKLSCWGKQVGAEKLALRTDDPRRRRTFKRKYGFVPSEDRRDLMEKPL